MLLKIYYWLRFQKDTTTDGFESLPKVSFKVQFRLRICECSWYPLELNTVVHSLSLGSKGQEAKRICVYILATE